MPGQHDVTCRRGSRARCVTRPDPNILVPRSQDILEPDVNFLFSYIVNRCATRFHRTMINNIYLCANTHSHYMDFSHSDPPVAQDWDEHFKSESMIIVTLYYVNYNLCSALNYILILRSLISFRMVTPQQIYKNNSISRVSS